MMRLSYIVIDHVESFSTPDEFRRVLAQIRECGFTGVEVNMTPRLLNEIERLQRWLDEAGLTVPSFLTGDAYREGLCLSSKSAKVREQTVEHLLRCVKAAKQLSAMFVFGGLQGTRVDEENASVAKERIVEGLRVVAREAEKQGVSFVAEPVNHLQVGFYNSIAEVCELINAVGSSALKPMLDTFHMNIEERSMTEPILNLRGELAHLHLCESNGAALGTGHVDFQSVFTALKEIGYSGYGSMKIYRGLGIEDGARTGVAFFRSLPAANGYLQ